MERLVRLAAVLHQAGAAGVPADRLVQVAGFTGEGDPRSQLSREFRHMRAVGWQIDNIGGAGDHAVYKMTSVDNRLRVLLTEPQQAALRRAVLLADRKDLADRLGLTGTAAPTDLAAAMSSTTDSSDLNRVLRAVQHRCLLRFHYNGSGRVVHPGSVRARNGAWLLRACEDGDGQVKNFVVSRMSEVTLDEPATATRPSMENHPGLHPMSWEYDEPVDVTLRAATEFAPDVRRWLGDPASESVIEEGTEFVYRVTNRAGLRARIYQLGTRVTLVGPPEIKQELIDELAEMAGE